MRAAEYDLGYATLRVVETDTLGLDCTLILPKQTVNFHISHIDMVREPRICGESSDERMKRVMIRKATEAGAVLQIEGGH